jgi:cation:H+ antiporter
MLLVSILFWLFMSNLILSRVEGTIFLLLIIAYIYMLFRFSSKKDLQTVVSKYETKMSLGKIIIILILADAGLAIGSDLLVDNASIIAGNLGVDERTIAITIIAFGTSLPELSTSLIAALHQETDISIGNIIGSNIFNILGIIGITSVVRPLKVNPEFIRNDIFWMLGTSALLYLFILPFGGSKLGRYKAAILLIVYCVYLYILYFRAT